MLSEILFLNSNSPKITEVILGKFMGGKDVPIHGNWTQKEVKSFSSYHDLRETTFKTLCAGYQMTFLPVVVKPRCIAWNNDVVGLFCDVIFTWIN